MQQFFTTNTPPSLDPRAVEGPPSLARLRLIVAQADRREVGFPGENESNCPTINTGIKKNRLADRWCTAWHVPFASLADPIGPVA